MEKKIALQELRKHAMLDLATANDLLKMMAETLEEQGAMKFWKDWSEEFYYRALVVGFYGNIVKALTNDEEESLRNLLELRQKLEVAWRAGIGQESTSTMEQLNKEKESEAAAEALGKVNTLIFHLKK